MAPIDVPPFDRSNVDGFAVRSADLASAGEGDAGSPDPQRRSDRLRHRAGRGRCCRARRRRLRPAVRCRAAPMPSSWSSTPSPQAPRAIEIRRAASPGQFVSYAGSDIARGEALLRAGTMIGSREIGMLAACGIAQVSVARRPRVAVISTGDELVQPGNAAASRRDLRHQRRDRHRGDHRRTAARRRFSAPSPTTRRRSKPRCASALESSDMLVLSGGTSKGAGDVSHRIIARLGKPGIIAHGVALKPGKPLCLAVCDGKPVVILPGFPTSAMFTFHDMIVPVLRRMAGLPPRSDAKVTRKSAGADRLRTRPHRIRHGVAGRRRRRPDRLSHRQGIAARSRHSRRPTVF